MAKTDYNADFLVMLETWEAAVNFRSAPTGSARSMKTARLLGWTTSDDKGLTHLAKACAGAEALIADRYKTPEDFAGLNIETITRLVGAERTSHRKIDEGNFLDEEKDERHEYLAEEGRNTAHRARAVRSDVYRRSRPFA